MSKSIPVFLIVGAFLGICIHGNPPVQSPPSVSGGHSSAAAEGPTMADIFKPGKKLPIVDLVDTRRSNDVPEVAILFIVKETEHICSYLEHVWKFFYSRPYGVDILLVETTRIDVFKQEDQVFALPQGKRSKTEKNWKADITRIVLEQTGYKVLEDLELYEANTVYEAEFTHDEAKQPFNSVKFFLLSLKDKAKAVPPVCREHKKQHKWVWGGNYIGHLNLDEISEIHLPLHIDEFNKEKEKNKKAEEDEKHRGGKK